MNLGVNHSRFRVIDLVRTYKIHENPVSNGPISSGALVLNHRACLVPELVYRGNEWGDLITASLMMLSAALVAFFCIEARIIDVGLSQTELALKYTWIIPGAWLAYTTIFYFLIEHFCDHRYLIFQDSKVIVQSRYTGRRVYEADDLTFILLKLWSKYHIYQLEVEIPDPTLPENRRRIILETAANLDTMNGILAVLFPLMRGDTGPYSQAVQRDFFELAPEEKSNLWKRWQYFQSHLHVWFLNYKVNEILFKIVHGSRESLMAKENQRGSQDV
jgi:hypothetical protein